VNTQPLAQSECLMGEEESRDDDIPENGSQPPAQDDPPHQLLAMLDSAMPHVEQWLTTKYAAAFVWLTQAEIETAHWGPE
jgi:hypothetical protein